MTDSRIIQVRCPQCGHVFEVDLARAGIEQIIHKGDEGAPQYRLRCPVDHAFFVITVPEDLPPAQGVA